MHDKSNQKKWSFRGFFAQKTFPFAHAATGQKPVLPDIVMAFPDGTPPTAMEGPACEPTVAESEIIRPDAIHAFNSALHDGSLSPATLASEPPAPGGGIFSERLRTKVMTNLKTEPPTDSSGPHH